MLMTRKRKVFLVVSIFLMWYLMSLLITIYLQVLVSRQLFLVIINL